MKWVDFLQFMQVELKEEPQMLIRLQLQEQNEQLFGQKMM